MMNILDMDLYVIKALGFVECTDSTKWTNPGSLFMAQVWIDFSTYESKNSFYGGKNFVLSDFFKWWEEHSIEKW